MPGYKVVEVVSIALGDIDIEIKPSSPWYSDNEWKMPVIRVSDTANQEKFYAVSKGVVDNLIVYLQQIQALPVQTPRDVYAIPEIGPNPALKNTIQTAKSKLILPSNNQSL